MPEERRKNKRVACHFDVFLADSAKPIKVPGNVSQSGIFMICPKSFRPMALYQINFRLPGLSEKDNQIKCKALVAWSQENQNKKYGTGFSFFEISDEDKKKIKKFIEQKIRL